MTSTQPRKWDGRAGAYADTFAGQCAHAIGPLLDALGARPGETLLDVGTGAGAVAVDALGRGCTVTAVDPEDDMLALAAIAAPGAVLVRAALPSLPLPDASADIVVANFVLNHVPDPAAATAELRRVLRPGGRLGVSVWPAAATPLRALWDEVLADAGIVVPARVPAVDALGTPDGLGAVLAAVGLRVRDTWVHEFEHVVDAELWWSGPARGVAGIGQTYLTQTRRDAPPCGRLTTGSPRAIWDRTACSTCVVRRSLPPPSAPEPGDSRTGTKAARKGTVPFRAGFSASGWAQDRP